MIIIHILIILDYCISAQYTKEAAIALSKLSISISIYLTFLSYFYLILLYLVIIYILFNYFKLV
jgi:hypothetical protein